MKVAEVNAGAVLVSGLCVDEAVLDQDATP